MTTLRLRAASLAAAAACATLSPAHAELVDIAWNASGEFQRSLNIAPGKFAELCGALKAGESVQWRFEAGDKLNFNIHFHEGKEVRYPARADQVKQSQGLLAVESAQDYCWMWTNKTAAAAGLEVHLQKR